MKMEKFLLQIVFITAVTTLRIIEERRLLFVFIMKEKKFSLVFARDHFAVCIVGVFPPFLTINILKEELNKINGNYRKPQKHI